jgi:hypothetical protein
MKRTILTVIALAALAITAVQAQQTIPVSPTPLPGSPGTATPTPYPQISPAHRKRPRQWWSAIGADRDAQPADQGSTGAGIEPNPQGQIPGG